MTAASFPTLMLTTRSPRLRTSHFPFFALDNYAPQDVYDRLVTEFPSLEEMTKGHQHGKKFINDRELAGREAEFFADKPTWKSMIDLLRSQEFMDDVERLVRPALLRHRWFGAFRKWRVYQGRSVAAPFERPVQLTYEFSGMPPGTYVNPHTDKASKLITFVWHFPEPGWRPEHSGATLFMTAKNPKHNTNWANYKLPFEELELLERSDVAANRLVMFAKTGNSWHAVPRIECDPGMTRRVFIFNFRYPVERASDLPMRAFESLHRRSEKWRFRDFAEVNRKPDYE